MTSGDAERTFRHKWWGWGPEGTRYDMESRPRFWAWLRKVADLEEDPPLTPPVARSAVVLPPRRAAHAFEAELARALRPHQVRDDEDDRLAHAFGRSYRDLVRLRAGQVSHPPDLVVYPESHEDVEAVVGAAAAHDVVLIPFGGGTNIVGCVEPDPARERPVATLDLRRMNRLLAVDQASLTADLEPGMFGPQIEDALRRRGLTLGHHPDSFVYSTLGGWIATRSAGTQSNAYGKIEDMVVALRVVTPRGTLETRRLPAASNGPDLNRLMAGSEGTLGVITRATLRVHPVPETEDYRLLLFPSFTRGMEALHACVRRGLMPSLARLSDERETELIFAAKPPSSGLTRLAERPARAWLRSRGYARPAALVVAFEGRAAPTRALARATLRLLRRHGAVDLGRRGGEAWKASRYDVPYLRDFLMDYGVIADSFETATLWSGLLPLYERAREAVNASLGEVLEGPGYVGCHVSHLYETGACLYFTVGGRPRGSLAPEDLLERYTALKAAATEAMVAHGGALSHHHAVGYEHAPWLERELSAPGLEAVRALKAALDPAGVLCPGNLVAPRLPAPDGAAAAAATAAAELRAPSRPSSPSARSASSAPSGSTPLAPPDPPAPPLR